MKALTLVRGVLLGIVILCPRAALADELGITSPKPVVKTHPRRAVFLVGASALALATSWDWGTTSALVHRGGSEVGSRWATGPYPTNRQITLFSSVNFAPQATGFYVSERSQHKFVRWSGRALMGWAIASHIVAGFRNHQLCRPTGVCFGPGNPNPFIPN